MSQSSQRPQYSVNLLQCVERGLLILQTFRHFTYVTTHFPILPSLQLRHSSFSNPSVASPRSQFILQPFFRFSYVTSSSPNSSGEPPMVSGSPLTARVPSSRLCYSKWVSWWKERSLGTMFSGFLPFYPATNFIPPFLHTQISFISFHFIRPCDGASGVVGRHRSSIEGFIASHLSTRSCVRQELS